MLLLSVLTLLGVSGCSQNQGYPGYNYPGQFGTAGIPPAGAAGQFGQPPITGPSSVFAQQQTNPQLAELQRRTQQLDDANRQLTTQLAQSQQQAQAYRERAELVAKQLQDANNQNKELLAANQQYLATAQSLQQSMTVRGGARLTANNSLVGSASRLQIPGAQVIPDGDLIRIRLPADQLFSPGTVQPNPSGAAILDQVANTLIRQFPRQRAGIEGHTDSSQLAGTSAYQLASAQAQGVLDQLVRRNGVPTQQLFIIAHGPNHPLADNQTPAGRAENRRIEVVIYPDTF